MPSSPIAASWSPPSSKGRGSRYYLDMVGPALTQAASGISTGIVEQARHERGRVEALSDETRERGQSLEDADRSFRRQGTLSGFAMEAGEQMPDYETRVGEGMGLRAEQGLAPRADPVPRGGGLAAAGAAGFRAEAAPFFREDPLPDAGDPLKDELTRATIALRNAQEAKARRPNAPRADTGPTPLELAQKEHAAFVKSRFGSTRDVRQKTIAAANLRAVNAAARAAVTSARGRRADPETMEKASPAWLEAQLAALDAQDNSPELNDAWDDSAASIERKYGLAPGELARRGASPGQETTDRIRTLLRRSGGTKHFTDMETAEIAAFLNQSGAGQPASPAAAPPPAAGAARGPAIVEPATGPFAAPEPQLGDFPASPDGVAAYNRAYDAWEARGGPGVVR